MEIKTHTGQIIKDELRKHNLDDKAITTLTPFEQPFLSKIYTSSEIDPRYLNNFLFIINKVFDVDISLDNSLHTQEAAKA